MNRRELVKTLSLGTIALSFFNKSFADREDEKPKPIVLSTWYNQRDANVEAWSVLANNGTALDAVEKGVQVSENDIMNCCVGLGANPDATGRVTLDACIMDHLHNIGCVGALERIKSPIHVARLIMEKTPHVFLVGEGAQKFAIEQGLPLEPEVLSEHAQKAYAKWLEKKEIGHKNIEKNKIERNTDSPFNRDRNLNTVPKRTRASELNHDTIGMLALDSLGNLSGACTTSGMGFKMRGRLGDSPIIGAGLYVDNEVGAATATGHGEEVIRICGSHLVVEYMRQGFNPEMACKKAVERIKNKTPRHTADLQIGFIALNKQGEFGAYSLQKGFDYAVMNAQYANQKFDSKSLM